MTNEQRRLKILDKKSYETQLTFAEREVVNKRWSFGISVVGSFLSTTGFIASVLIGSFPWMLVNTLSGSINIPSAKKDFEELKKALERKTELKSKINEIEAELNAMEKEDVNIKSYADAYALFASQHERHEQPTMDVPTIDIPNIEKNYSTNAPTIEFPTEEKSRGGR